MFLLSSKLTNFDMLSVTLLGEAWLSTESKKYTCKVQQKCQRQAHEGMLVTVCTTLHHLTMWEKLSH